MKILLLTVSILISQFAFAQNAQTLRCHNQPNVAKESPYLLSFIGISTDAKLKALVKELTSASDGVIQVDSIQNLEMLGMKILTLSVNTQDLLFPAVVGFDENAAIDSLVASTIARETKKLGLFDYILECNTVFEAQPKAGGIN